MRSLGPLPGRGSALERLVAEGRIVPARLDLTELGPPPELPREISISEALAAQRCARAPLGSRLAARFAGLGLTEEIPESRGEPASPADPPRR
ncbi:MAG TPA: hypothetical protein VKM72_19315 [Thermoanaerobaculia bacterium]|nr:hypothetical protein [Thermoanaerobaculia bacterium]